MQLTPHFTLEELVHSSVADWRGIDNSPTQDIVATLTKTAQGLERIRGVLGVPMIISSGYRCPALNAAVGGAHDSQHVLGQAADFTAPQAGDPLTVCKIIVAHRDLIMFDQLIYEGRPDGVRWAHVSFAPVPRLDIFTAHFNGGRATYTEGLA